MKSQVLNLLKRNKIEYEEVQGGKSHGAEVRIECPRCISTGQKSEDKKLYLNTDSEVFLCWRCQWHGSISKLRTYFTTGTLLVQTGVPSFRDLFDHLRSLDEPHQWVNLESRIPYGTVPASLSKTAMKYLQSRNISRELANEFGILYTREGFYEKRVLIPIFDYFGTYKTFVARAVGNTVRKKYLFPKGCSTSKLLFNSYTVRRRLTNTNIIWIVEGVFDAIHCFPRAVATFGKHISDAQIKLLRVMNYPKVALLWDWDAWAITNEEWKKTISRLLKYFEVIPVKLPNKKTDPTNYSMAQLDTFVRETSRA